MLGGMKTSSGIGVIEDGEVVVAGDHDVLSGIVGGLVGGDVGEGGGIGREEK